MPHIKVIGLDLQNHDLSQLEEAVLAPIRSRLFEMPTLGEVEKVVALLKAATVAPTCFRVEDDHNVFAVWEWVGAAAVVYTFERYHLACIDVIVFGPEKQDLSELWRQLGLSNVEREPLDASVGSTLAHLAVHDRGGAAQILGMIAYVPTVHRYLAAVESQ